MGLQGARLVGILLVWMAVGFAIQAATAQYEYALGQEAGIEVAPPSPTRQASELFLAGALALTGVYLMIRDPGRGAAPGVALGHEVRPTSTVNRCYRCRAKWPRDATACPKCGAARLR